MPSNVLVKKTYKSRGKFNLSLQEKTPAIDAGNSNSAIHEAEEQVRAACLDPSIEEPISGPQMQLSLPVNKVRTTLPKYPIADTVALILLLVNFPNLVITASHLLFSYREHLTMSTNNQNGAAPPLFLLFFIDAVVVIFAALVLPSLRHIVTDISHVIIAISMSGAQWKLLFPFAVGVTTLRGSIDSFNSKITGIEYLSETDEVDFLTNILRYGARVFRPIRPSSFQETSALFRTSVLEYIKSAIAIHIFSLGILRLINYWIHTATIAKDQKEEQSQSNTNSMRMKRKATQDQACSRFSGLSIWEQFLRWRAEISGRRHELATLPRTNEEGRVNIAEIATRYVVINITTNSHASPHFGLRVNGLPWDSKVVQRQCTITYPATSGPNMDNKHTIWTLQVDNLSAKTEYEFVLEFQDEHRVLGIHEFAICTSAKSDVKSDRLRAELHSLPQLNTAVDDVVASSESTHVTGPQSPVTTLEETVANASEGLEERRLCLKKTRRENTKRLQGLQRDIDHLNLRVTGGSDKHEQRMQGRMLSLQTEVRRIQDLIEEMESERQRVIDLKMKQQQLWQQGKARRDHEAGTLQSVREYYDAQKVQHEKKFAAVEVEALRTRAKADKLSLKRTKIQQDLDRIADDQDEILKREFRDRISLRESINNDRLQLEADYLKSILDVSQRADLLELYGSN